MTIEFLTITLILITYLSVVFSLFASTKSSLTLAVDKKLENYISTWVNFINQRPQGTLIKINVTPFPKRIININCGQITQVLNKKLSIYSECSPFNITTKTCLELEKIEKGVSIEVC